MFVDVFASFSQTPFEVSGCDASQASHSALVANARTGRSVLLFDDGILYAFFPEPGR